MDKVKIKITGDNELFQNCLKRKPKDAVMGGNTMTQNEQQPQGIALALEALDKTEKEYLVHDTDTYQQRVAKQHALSALRRCREELQAAAAEPEPKPAKKKTKTTA